MWERILNAVLTVAGFVIGRIKGYSDRKKKWLELINLIEADLNGSAELMKDDEIQKDEIEEIWEEKYDPEPEAEQPKEDLEIASMERSNPGMKFKRKSNGSIVRKA